MKEVSIIGVGLAKQVFQLHGATVEGELCSAGSCRASSSSLSCRRNLSAAWRWRHARPHITGGERWRDATSPLPMNARSGLTLPVDLTPPYRHSKVGFLRVASVRDFTAEGSRPSARPADRIAWP